MWGSTTSTTRAHAGREVAQAHKRIMLIFLESPPLAPFEIHLLINTASPSRAGLANTPSNCAVLLFNRKNADVSILTACALAQPTLSDVARDAAPKLATSSPRSASTLCAYMERLKFAAHTTA